MAGFCAAPISDLGLVRGLLTSVDCNVRVMSEAGYHAVTAPNSQLAIGITALLTIYVALLGLRLMLGLAPLRIGDLTVTILKIALVLALATSWPTYQQVVFDTLFRGPEQIAASMMGALQPADSLLRGNPFDGLQAAYDQMQASAALYAGVSPPSASPLMGGLPSAAFSLNLASFLMLITTLGVVLASKIVLGLLLALGPIFIALLLFDGTRGVFEGWLRASLAFALAPLFALLALVVQLMLIEPHLVALAQTPKTGNIDLAATAAVFLLSVISAMVSAAGVVGIFIVALGFKLPWRASAGRMEIRSEPARTEQQHTSSASSPGSPQPANSRVAAVTAAAASMQRRESRILEDGGGTRRISVGGRSGTGAAPETPRRQQVGQTYRRAAQPRRAASSVRRDR